MSGAASSRIGVLALFGILLWCGVASAATINVDCAGTSAPPAFGSINAALNFLAASGKSAHTIVVSGTCTESVTIEGWDHLNLQGNPGAAIVADASLANCAPFTPACPAAVLVVTESKAIGVRGLLLQGAGASGTPPAFVDDSTVTFFQCTFQNGGGSDAGGLFIVGISRVVVSKSIFQDNHPSGLRVDPGGVVEIRDSVVQRNGSLGGIRVFGGHANVAGFNAIQNNFGPGISLDHGSVNLFAFDSQPTITDNTFGITLSHGSDIAVIGGALIERNSNFGLLLESGSAAVLGFEHAPPVIQRNGSAGSVFGGGIFVGRNSTLDVSSAQVINNSGKGIAVRNDSSARIANTTITGNSDAGVSVLILSSGEVFGNSISGNGSADLNCSPDSFVSGNLTGIQKVFCPNVNVEPIPGPRP